MPELFYREIPKNIFWKYGQALVLVLVAVLAGLLWYPDLIPFLVSAAVVLGTLLGGRGPGLLILGLGSLAITDQTLTQGPESWQALALSLGGSMLLGLILIALVERLHRAHREKLARQAADAFLAHAGSVLVESIDFETALRQLARLASTHFSDWCLVTVLESHSNRPTLVIAGRDADHEHWTRSLEQAYQIDLQGRHGSGKAIVSGQPVLIERFTDAHLAEMVPDAEQLALFRRMRVHSFLSVPLRARGRIIGSIAFGLSATSQHFGTRDVRLAEALAERAALAIDNALLYRQAREAEAALREKETDLQRAYAFREQVFENASHSIFALDLSGHIVLVNRAGAAIAGHSAETLLGQHFSVVFPPEELPGFSQCFAKIAQEGLVVRDFELSIIRLDGQRRLISLNITPLFEEGRVINVVGTAEDITERRENERRLAQLAHCDVLTGLPNRVLLQDRLTHALAHAQRYGRLAALLFLDLDGFKQVNDSLGHEAGDVLLKTIATRLQDVVRVDDTVARLGGDEFVILLEEIATIAEAAEIASRILHAVAEPVSLPGRVVQITGSIGISVYPQDGKHAATLLKNADTAMYQAKQQGRNGVQFFSPPQETPDDNFQLPLDCPPDQMDD